MKFDKKLVLIIGLSVAGALLFILTISNLNPVWEILIIVLFFSSAVANYKWHRIRWLHGVLIIVIWLLLIGLINNIFFKYPDLGTVVQE